MRAMMFSFHNPKFVGYLIISLFIISRVFILLFPPPFFTEIIYSYMPYAHLWASGVRPYLDQWYEYPPATIPLFYVPHLIDSFTHNHFFHLNYSMAYKLQLLLVDVGLFVLIWTTLKKIQPNKLLQALSLVFYILVTAKAHHFIYDTMDIVFAAALTLSVTSPIVFKGALGKTGLWFGYFLAIALKLLNGPLGLVYAVLDRKEWKKHIIYGFICFGLVWIIPLLLYRSSLQVMIVYHQIRGLQVDSAVAIVVRVLNEFTKSESIIEVFKNYEVSGPISNTALNIVELIFPITLVIFIAWTTKIAWGLKQSKHKAWRISVTLGYILLLMLISKVQSTPFLLWALPLLAIFPYRDLSTQLKFLIPSMIIIGTSMSPIPNIQLGIFRSSLWIDIIRTTLFVWMFIVWIIEDRWLRLSTRSDVQSS